MQYKTGLCLNAKKLVGFHTHYYKHRPVFHSRSNYITEKLHSLTVKKIIIWYKYLLLLDRVFSEHFGTNFNPQCFKVLKLV